MAKSVIHNVCRDFTQTHRHFEGAAHAHLYGKYRPTPPASLIKRVVSYLKEQYNGPLETAVDVGCGSGQSTEFFSPFFQTVVGTDISAAQIENAGKANQAPNVRYEVSPAEKINVPDGSVQLVTACQAAHWFDLPKFYTEVHRALSTNGVLALYGYEFPVFVTGDAVKDAKLDSRLQQFYQNELDGYVLEQSKQVYLGKYTEDRYHFGLPSGTKVTDGRVFEFGNQDGKGLLFRDFTREEGYNEDCPTTLRDMVNYCSTWSGFQNYVKQKGQDEANELLANYEKELLKIFQAGEDPEEVKFTRRIKYFLLLGRK